MPVCLNSNRCSLHRRPAVKSPTDLLEPSGSCLRIGVINNMPDTALEATERQFRSLLDSASEGIRIHLSFHALPGVSRSELARHHITSNYSSVENLWGTHLDGLIVTGAEPLAPSLMDEPYWDSFTRVLEWARENTHSTIWSCLAAHAAVLHMDGIGRRKSREKHCGIFKCERVCDHRLTAGTPSTLGIPHSRWNGLSEDDLRASGYSVLTRTANGGVDTFVKQQTSLFVFFQGHPEYESDTLLREYRRDIGRYFRGDTDTYPSIPCGYFDPATVDLLIRLRDEAIAHRSEELCLKISRALREVRVEDTWGSTAAGIYRNWLEYICARKEASARLSRIELNTEATQVSELVPL